jgi:hypothetical protein
MLYYCIERHKFALEWRLIAFRTEIEVGKHPPGFRQRPGDEISMFADGGHLFLAQTEPIPIVPNPTTGKLRVARCESSGRCTACGGVPGKSALTLDTSHHDEAFMGIDAEPIKEVLDDLFTLLEALETQNIAVLQFLKDQGIAPGDKLAPYLDRAGNASSVKWRAARARMNHLLAPAPKKSSATPAEKQTKDEETYPPDVKPKDHQPETKATDNPEKETRPLKSETRPARPTVSESDDAKPNNTKTPGADSNAASNSATSPPNPEHPNPGHQDQKSKTEKRSTDNSPAKVAHDNSKQDALTTHEHAATNQKESAT